MRLGKKMENMITECHPITDDNLKKILLEIPPLIEQAKGSYSRKQVADLMEIYLDACIYIRHYTRPYHTLKKFDDFTAELNGEMYTGKYFSMAEEKYHAAHNLGKAQQFYGRALTELLKAVQEKEAREKIKEGCRHFESSLELLKQLDPGYFADREYYVLDFYLTFLTLLGLLGEREEFQKYFKDIFTCNLDFSKDACQFLFYQIEIIMLTLDGHYESALAIYRQFFEVQNESYVPAIGDFIKLCYENLDQPKEYERFLINAYKLELEEFEKLDPRVMGSLLEQRKKMKLDIYICPFTQEFNVIGGSPAVYKFN